MVTLRGLLDAYEGVQVTMSFRAGNRMGRNLNAGQWNRAVADTTLPIFHIAHYDTLFPMSKSTQREADFQRTIIEMAELHKWRVYHVANVKGQLRSKTSEGFPDLVLARKGRLVFAELKLEGEGPTDEQEIWLALLRSAELPWRPTNVFVWRPSDWRQIEALLR